MRDNYLREYAHILCTYMTDHDTGPIDISEFNQDLSKDDIDIKNIEYDEEKMLYLSKSSIKGIHQDIIEEDEEASAGVISPGDIEFALNAIENGFFGEVPETVHEKAFELMRLLAANHAFADGNKRTALNSTWSFYAINDKYFDYGEEIKAILKLLAVKEEMVDEDEVVDYFSDLARPAESERVPTALIKANRLFTYYEYIMEELKSFFEGEKGKKEIQEFEMERKVKQYLGVVGELRQLKENHSNNLDKEIINQIEEIEEDCEATLDFLVDIADVASDSEDNEEFTERLEDMF